MNDIVKNEFSKVEDIELVQKKQMNISSNPENKIKIKQYLRLKKHLTMYSILS